MAFRTGPGVELQGLLYAFRDRSAWRVDDD